MTLAAVLYACSNESNDKKMDAEQPEKVSDTGQFPQKWQLIKMSGNMAGSETTGDQMAWQESYVLNEDHTFRKVREQSGEKKEASGAYAYVNLSDGKYLELSYNSANELIGNCTGDAKELLRLQDKNKLIGTWQACDGPGLVYERVN